jgi:SET and MYND domain-containing protein
VRARSELIVAFGGGKNEGGQVGEEVRKTLISVEKELGMWKEGINSAIADMPKGVLGK